MARLAFLALATTSSGFETASSFTYRMMLPALAPDWAIFPLPRETHLHLHLVSASFEGVGRVARSRLVHEALAEEFASGLHALRLKLQTPEEYAQENSRK